MTYSGPEAVLLSRYVSNLDRNVYSIFNLPEEVVAVVFAKVSRSPKSFRVNLLELIHDRELAVVDVAAGAPGRQFDLEKARRFHEKWVVGYGHSSVAELAVAHVGIERISRLASARLELSNPFLSFVEYSQRYQQPQRGDYFTPLELERHPELLRAFHELQTFTYDTYEVLQAGLVKHLKGCLTRGEGESDRAFAIRVEKTAFEDARYALTLAMHTNLGMTGNGRAIRDSVVQLLSDPYPECRQLAADIRQEVSASVLPVLLKYAEPNAYLLETRAALMGSLAALPGSPAAANTGTAPAEVTLRNWTGRSDANPEIAALDAVLAGLMLTEASLTAPIADGVLAGLSAAAKAGLFQAATARLGAYDHPLPALARVQYEAEFAMSEACWHQLLRHCRKIDFAPQEPTTAGGWVVPPHVAAAGLEPLLAGAVDQCARLHDRLQKALPPVAPYAVANAHRRRCLANLSLWELYHLVNLRCSPEAQWEIRQAVLDLAEQVAVVHPHLVPSVRRSGGGG